MPRESSPDDNFGVDYTDEPTLAYEDETMIRFVLDQREDENFFPFRGHRGTASISGRGVSQDDCGTYSTHWLNDAHTEIKHKRKTCHLQGCPICFRIWADSQAERSAGYLWGFTEKFGKALAHWSFSVPKFRGWRHLDKCLKTFIEDWTNDPMGTVLAVTRHPRRIKCNTPGCNYEPKTHRIKGHGVCPQCKCYNWVWAWSPHLHLVTSFRFNPGIKSPEHPTGYFAHCEGRYMKARQWVAKLISPISTKKVLRDVLRYEFGHALFDLRGSHPAIRYFGYSAKNHFRAEVTRLHTPILDSQGNPFYKLDDTFIEFGECSDPDEPCLFIQINKPLPLFDVQWAHNVCGKRIMLTSAEYKYDLISTAIVLNGVFVRIAPPRKKLKEQFASRGALSKPIFKRRNKKLGTVQFQRLNQVIYHDISMSPMHSAIQV